MASQQKDVARYDNGEQITAVGASGEQYSVYAYEARVSNERITFLNVFFRFASCRALNRQHLCGRVTSDNCPHVQPATPRLFQRVLVTALLLLATACSQADPYADDFQQIRLGDSRSRVVAVMGRPESVNSVEIPLIKAEQMAWRAPMKGRVYIILIVMDHVAAKGAVD